MLCCPSGGQGKGKGWRGFECGHYLPQLPPPKKKKMYLIFFKIMYFHSNVETLVSGILLSPIHMLFSSRFFFLVLL